MGSRFSHASNSPVRALSLLSSKAASLPWVSPSDLSSRSSAALRELIEENRATLLARQLLSNRSDLPNPGPINHIALPHWSHQNQVASQSPQLTDGWDHLQGAGAHVTLDLMEVPNSSFGAIPRRSRAKDGEEDCSEIWKSLEDAHVRINARACWECRGHAKNKLSCSLCEYLIAYVPAKRKLLEACQYIDDDERTFVSG